jgi:cytochrome P450
VLFYHILSTPPLYQRLMAELETAIPDPSSHPSWSELEQLPYLISLPAFQDLRCPLLTLLHSACIQEGLRLSYGSSMRNQRVSPDGPMIYRPSPGVSTEKSEYVIPQGTPVGMTSVLVHHNEAIFPHSKTFNPDRWLNERGQRDRSKDKYICSFGRGTRQCLGIK